MTQTCSNIIQAAYLWVSINTYFCFFFFLFLVQVLFCAFTIYLYVGFFLADDLCPHVQIHSRNVQVFWCCKKGGLWYPLLLLVHLERKKEKLFFHHFIIFWCFCRIRSYQSAKKNYMRDTHVCNKDTWDVERKKYK